MISTSDVRELANEHRFSTANLEKVFRLVDLLAEIYAHPFLKDCLVLKGGTAINVFLFDVPRLSVDIDFNYIGSADKDTMVCGARASFASPMLRSPSHNPPRAGFHSSIHFTSLLDRSCSLQSNLQERFLMLLMFPYPCLQVITPWL